VGQLIVQTVTVKRICKVIVIVLVHIIVHKVRRLIIAILPPQVMRVPVPVGFVLVLVGK
jgi:hypothetical protein